MIAFWRASNPSSVEGGAPPAKSSCATGLETIKFSPYFSCPHGHVCCRPPRAFDPLAKGISKTRGNARLNDRNAAYLIHLLIGLHARIPGRDPVHPAPRIPVIELLSRIECRETGHRRGLCRLHLRRG